MPTHRTTDAGASMSTVIEVTRLAALVMGVMEAAGTVCADMDAHHPTSSAGVRARRQIVGTG
ncbi:hypothetical protein WT92_10980 [Burkholderia stagnalis]|uniref:Uncharacterized protein n=1 Tax=Burkholderia stagnalis TaxID=1503054 RepID=A0A106NQ87_9BURK|nr:hypothetical protein WT09_18175 [Burkholderia stagnalis]KVX68294.1 hypothetical protein WT33_02140 [Burkholderia stagnalis]KVZ03106.1 hypothetical protein WT35_29440 [Burkholderia stagnalis]KWA44269.1 hypothetical protein WT42_31230 [Burkholderia stagnalis]KWA49650.1 hypothetical protein WT43_30665 [Burkholderia stagnalis]